MTHAHHPKSLFVSAFVAASFFVASYANADISGIHNTGVDGTDTLVAPAAVTLFWELSSRPGGASEPIGSSPYRYYNGAYFADTAGAAWVSPGSNGNASAGGDYVYALTVNLSGKDPGSVSVSGVFSTDNDGDIWLNGESAAASVGFSGFGSEVPFTLDSGWVDGDNTIYVRVNNGGNPTAFYVRFENAGGEPPPATPEPAKPVPGLTPWSMLLLTLVIAGFGALILNRQ